MEGLLILLAVLLVLAIPVSIVLLLVGQSRLKARIVSVETRLAQQMVAVPVMEDPAPVETRTEVVTVERGPVQAVADAAAPLQASEAMSQPNDLVPPVPQPQGPIVLTAARASAVGVWMQRNWIYVISAASLALAGVFLVQYSVQNGLLPPWGRVMAAYLLGLGLIAGGEVVRRRRGDDEGSDTAYLPSVFAGAGLVTLFAASVAAQQMYGLIGPELTFGLLMATAAHAAIDDGAGDRDFYDAKIVTARYYAQRYFPDARALRTKLEAGSAAMMALPANMF